MNGLDEFLKTDVKAFEEELKRLDDVLCKAILTFKYRQISWCKGKECPESWKSCTNRCRTSCFAYEIAQYGEKTSSLVSSWSTSTNAMMLNIAMYLFEPDFQSLLIDGKKSLTIPKNAWEVFHSNENGKKDWNHDLKEIWQGLMNCFCTKHDNRSKPLNQGFHDSSSYGPNPWSSLIWFGEVILYHEERKYRRDDDLINLWYEIVTSRIKKALEKNLIDAFPAGIDGMRAARCYQLLERFKIFLLNDEEINSFSEIEQLVKHKLCPMFLDRIYQHLTSFEISDGLFDPGELVFSMEGLTILDDNRHYIKEVLLDRFFNVIHQSMLKSAFWKPAKPLNINPQGHTLLPLSAEVGNSLLRICYRVSDDPQKLNLFRKYKDMFIQYTKWVVSQMVTVRTRLTVHEELLQWLCKLTTIHSNTHILSLDCSESCIGEHIFNILENVKLLKKIGSNKFGWGDEFSKDASIRKKALKKLFGDIFLKHKYLINKIALLNNKSKDEWINEINGKISKAQLTHTFVELEKLAHEAIISFSTEEITIYNQNDQNVIMSIANLIIDTLNISGFMESDGEKYKLLVNSNNLTALFSGYLKDNTCQNINNILNVNQKQITKDLLIRFISKEIGSYSIVSLILIRRYVFILSKSIVNKECLLKINDKGNVDWNKENLHKIVYSILKSHILNDKIRQQDYSRKALFALFPFFPEHIRKSLYLGLNTNSDDMEKQIKNTMNIFCDVVQPVIPIAIVLGLLSQLLKNKSLIIDPIQGHYLKISDNKKLETFFKDDFQDNELINLFNNIDINKETKWHGWHSEHVMQPLYNSRYIHLWATREYYIYLMQYRSMRSQEIAWSLLEKNDFKVTLCSSPKWYFEENIIKKWNENKPPSPSLYWKQTIMPEYEMLSGNLKEKIGVYEKIHKNFLKDDRKNPENCSWSMLLYGPPGTGKSLIAENLAKTLRWPLVTITPSDFIREGDANVEKRAKQIFRSLLHQQDLVVLFDEIDRLLLDRDAPMYFSQHDTFQFMTPGMLVKLKDLWKAKKVIFIIATNYEERIDHAAKRKGRIDHSLLLLPPDWLKRMQILIQEFIKNSPHIKDVINENPDIKEKISITIAHSIAFAQINSDHNLNELKTKTFGCVYEEIKKIVDTPPPQAVTDAIGQIRSQLEESQSEKKQFNIPNLNNLINTIKKSFESNFFASNAFETPSIRIESWLNRFKTLDEEQDKAFQTIQQPFGEVVGLYTLLFNEHESDDTLQKYFNDNPDALATIKRMLMNLGYDINIAKKKIEDLRIYKKIKFGDCDERLLDSLMNHHPNHNSFCFNALFFSYFYPWLPKK